MDGEFACLDDRERLATIYDDQIDRDEFVGPNVALGISNQP